MGAALKKTNSMLKGADCGNCPLQGRTPIATRVNRRAKLIIVGQEPGYEEEEEGKPFVGRSGRLLERVLEFWGINRAVDLHVTNACLCRAGRKLSAREQRQALVCCRPRLQQELNRCRATHVVALGKNAFWTLTGKAKGFQAWLGGPMMGSALKIQKKKELHPGETADFSAFSVVPTWHPAFCLRSPADTPYMQIHVGRAWQLATGQLPTWKWPKLHLWPNKTTVRALIRLLNSQKPIAIDIETQGTDPRNCPIMCLAFSDGKTTVSLPWKEYHSGKYGAVQALWDYEDGPRCYELATQILETKPLVAHNGAHDIGGLRHQYGFRIPDDHYVFDTLLAHAVVAPRLSHTLGHMACGEYHAPAWKAQFGVETDLKGAARFVKRPQERLREYNAQDALMTALCVKPLKQRLKHDTYQGEAQMALMMDKMRLGMKMTEVGIKVGVEKFARHRKNFMRKKAEARLVYERIADAAGFVHKGVEDGEIQEYFINPNAHAQNHKFFFDVLGCRPTKWSEVTSKPTLDEEVVSDYLTHHDERVRLAARALLRYRRWDKLLGTYITGLEKDSGNVVHTEWKVWGTRTGRWSSSPNLQNIPKPKYTTTRSGRKRVLAPGLRDLFVPRPNTTLIEADYSQLELRIVALLAGDPLLLNAYNAGKDVHQENANMLFNRQEASKEERHLAKTYVYACNYGANPQEIWKRLVVDFPNLSLMLVERMHERWFDVHKEIYQWQQRTIHQARADKYVECPLSGRRQYYPDGKIDFNEVLNFPVQGTGADIIDPAAIRVSQRIDWQRDKILLQVHDALIGETTSWKRLGRIFKEEMERPVELAGNQISFPVDLQVSKTDWGSMEERTL